MLFGKLFLSICYLRIKSELFFYNLKFKSELLKTIQNYNNIGLKK